MICERCGGEMIWMGPLTALTHTQCYDCGGINCQVPDECAEHDDEQSDGEEESR
jgi:hypothetical protein